MNKFLIVGAGFSGAVIAECLSRDVNNRILLIDERSHIAGNCHTHRDPKTKVMEHVYGPHIFNTDNKEVWDYIQQFGEMKPFINRVKSVYRGNVYSMPINLHTINQFFGKSMNPEEARSFIQNIASTHIEEPKNFEEQALKFIGEDLYKAFFYGYTKKQWGCEPSILPSGILKRLPVRFNYDDNYYTHPYQGIPKEGYTALVEKMLKADNIEIRLNTKYDSSWDLAAYDHVFYTGPIDAFFEYKYGRLSYRTVSFEKHYAKGDYQGNAVINYADPEIPYTRIHEHKHFTPWEEHEETIYFKEFSKETTATDIPFYPKRLEDDMDKLTLYQADVAKLVNITFLGRLATYRYMDMHHVIAEALRVYKKFDNDER